MTVELLTVDDVARVTRLSAYTVRAAVRDGDLAATKLRGRILVHPDDLAAWIDEGRIRARTRDHGDMPRPQPRSPRPAPPTTGIRRAVREARRHAA